MAEASSVPAGVPRDGREMVVFMVFYEILIVFYEILWSFFFYKKTCVLYWFVYCFIVGV